jgi:hypothetical protein
MKAIIKNVVPRTSNLKSIAKLYGVCPKTMAKRIKAIESYLPDRTGRRLFMINEVEIIFQHFGTPKIEVQVNECEGSTLFFQHAA